MSDIYIFHFKWVYTISQNFLVMNFIMFWKIQELFPPSAPFNAFFSLVDLLLVFLYYTCLICFVGFYNQKSSFYLFYTLLYTCQIQPFLTGGQFSNLQTWLALSRNFQPGNYIAWHIDII